MLTAPTSRRRLELALRAAGCSLIASRVTSEMVVPRRLASMEPAVEVIGKLDRRALHGMPASTSIRRNSPGESGARRPIMV